MFQKELAKYYHYWYRTAHDSAKTLLSDPSTQTNRIFKEYLERTPIEAKQKQAQKYLDSAAVYFGIISEYWDDIDFYSIGDNAFLTPSATEAKRREWEALRQ